MAELNETLHMTIPLAPGAWFPMGKGGTYWQILDLDKEAKTALVIAEKEICDKKYNEKCEDVTWETCTLREWLNGEYFENTFSEAEKAAILESALTNPDNPEYNTKGGNDTRDKIYLLSIEEAQKYFPDDTARATDHWWWLRSPGGGYDAAVVYRDGNIGVCGGDVLHRSGVRPAFKINLESDIFQSFLSEESPDQLRVPVIEISENTLTGVVKRATEVKIPEGITEIPRGFFKDMSDLTSITLPDSVTSIGYGAFSGCSSLTSIIIPDSVTNIGGFAFKGCKSLRELIIPNGVKSIGACAFSDCSSLTDIVIPYGVTDIGYGTFGGCSSLTSIIIPYGVTEIGWSAFEGCSSLTSINLPASVTSIGDRVFSGCSNLESIVIPGSVTGIGDRAFSGCSNLKSIVIPVSVTNIGNHVLQDCDRLNQLYAPLSLLIDPKDKMLGALTFLEEADSYSSEDQKKYIKYIFSQKKKILPDILRKDNVKALYVFSDAGKITKQNIDDEFLNPAILEKATQCIAFLMNWKEKNISADYLEKKFAREIDKDPFNVSDMKKLWSYDVLEDGIMITGYKGNGKSLEIPERIGNKPVISIDVEAFSTEKSGRYTTVKEILRKITSLYIPENIKFIGDCAFAGCESVSSVEVAPGNKAYRCRNNCLIDVAHKKIIAGFMNAVIPDDGSVINIGDYAFCGSSLNDMVIPDTITEIGVYAFSECKNIANITIPGTVKRIRQRAFSDISSLKNIILCDGIKIVEKRAFSGCENLQDITIPSSVTKIHDYAFYDSTYNLTIHTTEGSVLINSVIAQYANLQITPKASVSEAETVSSKNVFTFSNVASLDFAGKIFVLSGFDEAEEGKLTERIVSNGGTVKSSVVLATDYLVVNENYDHVTTKYKRAVELNEKGKNIKIISKAMFDQL